MEAATPQGLKGINAKNFIYQIINTLGDQRASQLNLSSHLNGTEYLRKTL